MKVRVFEKDRALIEVFLSKWMLGADTRWLNLWAMDECDPLYLDVDACELSSCIMELEKEGFAQSIKRLFQGDHFYRSDTGKCPRCWRYRPEIHWNNENLKEGDPHIECCDRCVAALKK